MLQVSWIRTQTQSSDPKRLVYQLAEDFPHHLSVHVGESEVAASVFESQLFVIEAKLV